MELQIHLASDEQDIRDGRLSAETLIIEKVAVLDRLADSRPIVIGLPASLRYGAGG